jgi:LuxR family maltose regulon positive regulatory protein
VLGERGSITENRHRWYVAMAQVRVATGDHAIARQLLDQAEELYRRGFYPDLRPLAAMRARVDLAAGDLAAVAEWADDHDVTVSFLHEYENLTLVRLLLANPASLGEALTLLDRLHADADQSRAGSLLEIGMLRALTHHALGHRREALAELHQALEQAPEPDGYVRLFLDEGAPMLALLQDAASEPEEHHAHRLLAAAEKPTPSARRPLADPLSDRELDVLRLLAGELTGPEIARHLFVSLNTLRTHTKRIFTKLDVNNRSAAIRRGRELGLL